MATETLDYPVLQTADGESVEKLELKKEKRKNVSEMSDYDLAQASSKGDMIAFEEVYNRHHRRVYAICLRMLKNSNEAEDLTQDVFIQLHRKIGSFRGDSAFTTWLHRLTVNQVLMHFRKRTVKFEKTTEEGETPDDALEVFFLNNVTDATVRSYYTSELVGETVMRYDPVPVNYDGCIPYEKGQKAWSSV